MKCNDPLTQILDIIGKSGKQKKAVVRICDFVYSRKKLNSFISYFG